MTPEELENRLINFSVINIDISGSLKKNNAGNHLSGQIARSGTSPVLNYGEARGAEMRSIHELLIN
jgi:hypothetical protein